MWTFLFLIQGFKLDILKLGDLCDANGALYRDYQEWSATINHLKNSYPSNLDVNTPDVQISKGQDSNDEEFYFLRQRKSAENILENFMWKVKTLEKFFPLQSPYFSLSCYKSSQDYYLTFIKKHPMVRFDINKFKIESLEYRLNFYIALSEKLVEIEEVKGMYLGFDMNDVYIVKLDAIKIFIVNFHSLYREKTSKDLEKSHDLITILDFYETNLPKDLEIQFNSYSLLRFIHNAETVSILHQRSLILERELLKIAHKKFYRIIKKSYRKGPKHPLSLKDIQIYLRRTLQEMYMAFYSKDKFRRGSTSDSLSEEPIKQHKHVKVSTQQMKLLKQIPSGSEYSEAFFTSQENEETLVNKLNKEAFEKESPKSIPYSNEEIIEKLDPLSSQRKVIEEINSGFELEDKKENKFGLRYSPKLIKQVLPVLENEKQSPKLENPLLENQKYILEKKSKSSSSEDEQKVIKPISKLQDDQKDKLKEKAQSSSSEDDKQTNKIVLNVSKNQNNKLEEKAKSSSSDEEEKRLKLIPQPLNEQNSKLEKISISPTFNRKKIVKQRLNEFSSDEEGTKKTNENLYIVSSGKIVKQRSNEFSSHEEGTKRKDKNLHVVSSGGKINEFSSSSDSDRGKKRDEKTTFNQFTKKIKSNDGNNSSDSGRAKKVIKKGDSDSDRNNNKANKFIPLPQKKEGKGSDSSDSHRGESRKKRSSR